MFKFNFSDVELEDDPKENLKSVSQPIGGETSDQPEGNNPEDRKDSGQYGELSMDELTKALPPALSYSPVVIPVGEGENRTSVTLLRRDLFDARFQLIAEDSGQAGSDEEQDLSTSASISKDIADGKTGPDALSFVDNPSDLVPGVYEGGLKTWECSLDLVETLFNLSSGSSLSKEVKGKRVLEVGCGTAIPSLYLLSDRFAQHSQPEHEIPLLEVVLQDYNELVLRLVTFPNVLLNWYASPLAEPYRERQAAQDTDQERFNIAEAGEIAVTPELVSTFISSLNENNIKLRFVSGSWEAMLNPSQNAADLMNRMDILFKPFDIVLTSETIYRLSSLSTLINLLKTATLGRKTSGGTGAIASLEDLTEDLSIHSRQTVNALCLVAAKVLYFGVGGGIIDFERLVKESHGQLETILERTVGVGRKIIKVSWV